LPARLDTPEAKACAHYQQAVSEPCQEQERRKDIMDKQSRKWRQASLIVFATTVVLIIPNLSRLVG
jgi:predicted nucleic acid-binding Zn ribbon protein